MLALRLALPLTAAILLAACGAPTGQEAVVPELTTRALTTSERLVTLRTNDQQHYLTAEGDGGGTMSADRTSAAAWERWVLADLNAEELESGDEVQIRHVSSDGTSFWLVADEGGGGPGSILRANRREPQAWETFVIEKLGGGVIESGDAVHLRAATHAYYVSAEQAGGLSGDGSVVVDRPHAQTWETFTLAVVAPQALCPFANSLCLFDRSNFDGARFDVKALDPEAGACIDLADHGWGARARSAVNTNSKSASVQPNADCTGHPIGIAGGGVEPTLPLLPNAAFVF